MVAKEDIHGQNKFFERNFERQIAKFFPEDQEDIRRFVDELLAQGYSIARVNKYISTMASISKSHKVPFRVSTLEDIKRYAAWLNRSDYKDWTKHDHKVILRRYMQWLVS